MHLFRLQTVSGWRDTAPTRALAKLGLAGIVPRNDASCLRLEKSNDPPPPPPRPIEVRVISVCTPGHFSVLNWLNPNPGRVGCRLFADPEFFISKLKKIRSDLNFYGEIFWIWIRIKWSLDPDSGNQKYRQKIKKLRKFLA